MENVTLFCFFASYLSALALEMTRLFTKSRAVFAASILFCLAGFVAHNTYLYFRSQAIDLPPLLSSTHDWLLVLAAVTVLFHLIVMLIDHHSALGLFLLPLVVLFVGWAYFVDDVPNSQSDVPRWWGMLHAALLVFAIASVAVALVLSAMYLVQHHRVKHKQVSDEGLHLHSLERLGRLNWWAVIVSVPLLTLGMGSGVALVAMSQDSSSPVSLLTPEFATYAVLWGAMVALFVWLLKSRHPAGRLVAWRTLWACSVLLGAILALTLFNSDGVHGSRKKIVSEVPSSEHTIMPHKPDAQSKQSPGLMALRQTPPSMTIGSTCRPPSLGWHARNTVPGVAERGVNVVRFAQVPTCRGLNSRRIQLLKECSGLTSLRIQLLKGWHTCEACATRRVSLGARHPSCPIAQSHARAPMTIVESPPQGTLDAGRPTPPARRRA